MEFEIQYIDPELLIPYENNTKLHSKRQIEDLAKAMQKRGFDQPVTVDNDWIIITGHGRREAALLAGIDKIPVIIRDDLSPSEIKAKRIEDNKLVSTDYDNDLMQQELDDLLSEDDSEIFGFSEKELALFGENDLMMDGDTDSPLDLGGDDVLSDGEYDNINEESTPADARGRVSLATLFGFKDIPMEHGRTVSDWFAQIEEETESVGAVALLKFIEGKK